MNPPQVPLSEVAPMAAVRARLSVIAERLRAQVNELGELRKTLPLPDERTLTVIYESDSNIDGFPALGLASNLEGYEDELAHVVDEMEKQATLEPPEDQGDDPLR